MTPGEMFLLLELIMLLYFVSLHVWYLGLNLISLITLSDAVESRAIQELPQGISGFEPPVTILVPAYNESDNIVNCIKALRSLKYPDFEIIVINDGSKDETLQILIREHGLVPTSEAGQKRVHSMPIRGVYASSTVPNLRVIDKENGGKPDALNAGLNFARCPYVLVTDADSVLEDDCLQNALRPFLQDPDTVESGGALRVLNGCDVEEGKIKRVGLPLNILGLFQVLEYIRSYLFSRMGLSVLNGVNVVSGAFYFARRQSLIEAGGLYLTVAEDSEITLHFHRLYAKKRKPYRITYIPDPVCWTDVPMTLWGFARQRIGWQRGLCEAVARNMGILFQPTFMGWIGFPALIIFEMLGPILEVAIYAYAIWAAVTGVISLDSLLAFGVLGIGLGGLLSVTALLMEELSFHVYPRFGQLLVLIILAFVENLGFRQLNSILRLFGIFDWMLRVLTGRTPDARP